MRIHEAAPEAYIVATHIEAINHWTLSKAELRDFADEQGFSHLLFIPADGEMREFNLERGEQVKNAGAVRHDRYAAAEGSRELPGSPVGWDRCAAKPPLRSLGFEDGQPGKRPEIYGQT